MAHEATFAPTLDPDLLDSFVDGRHAARDAEIDRALREADDPGTVFVSDEEVEAEWANERIRLLSRIGDEGA